MRKTSLVLAALLAVAGICVMLWPVFTGNRLQSSAATAVQEFLADRDEPEQQYPELLAELQAYNQRKLTPQILSARAIECKPFKKTHHEQLKLVTSFGWIDFDRLRGVEQDIRDILDQAGEYVDESRKAAIISAFSSRLGQLMVLAQVQRQEDDVAQDVEQDQAQDYGFKMEL